MKSMSDLMLQAHFKELRKELDKSLKKDDELEGDESVVLLREVFNYLKSKSTDCTLDEDGQELFEKVAKRLDEIKLNCTKEVRRKEFEKSIPKDFKLKKKGA